jgi:hypothetical protein
MARMGAPRAWLSGVVQKCRHILHAILKGFNIMNRSNLLTYIGAGLVGAGLLTAAIVMVGGRNEAVAARSDAPIAKTVPSTAVATPVAPTMISSAEADAWAAARAADTSDAYKVYLAAYPTGQFRSAAVDRLAEAKPEPAPRATPVRQASAQPARIYRTVERAPAPQVSRRNVAAECRAYVDQKLSAPSRTYRTVGGAAAGCAAGAMAGGDDGRNCVVGAIVGGATGALTAENRERRRMREVEYCIANGGPPR